ncbi:4'-phosphopantetheinyl transferase family protein [Arenibacter certesii]|uniref:4'-phosphopantetheinyl transferase n=1 Tax=Arenibacter certesii TaxID=228955 RepID=A0A918IYT9_9FLAO|nr:4'-phosphopantetheinyl transferase superfamily protein [Arenibacter certesii]GGW39324.1 4'-phosphopantetheinyl transferase [Arenibacter certesii]
MLSLNLEKLILPNNEIHFYYADINDFISKVGVMQERLTSDEKLRAGQFKFQTDQNRFIIARWLLRSLLSNYLELDFGEMILKYGEFGKPFFNTNQNIKFNLSHSGDMIVFGFVKNFNIGVDVEMFKSNFNVMDIALKFFSKKEVETLLTLPEYKREVAFYRCWTRKEAIIKADGSGMSFPLNTFSVTIDSDDKAELIEMSNGDLNKEKWRLFSIKLSVDYLAAVAVEGNIGHISSKALTLLEL